MGIAHRIRLLPGLAIFCLAATLILKPESAFSAATMPFTASELPVMANTPNLVYGSYGPVVKLDAPTFTTIPEPLYLDKKIEGEAEETQLPIKALVIRSTSDEASTTQLPKQSLSIKDLKKAAIDELKKCQDRGSLCDASITLEGEQATIELTPLVVESVNIELKDDWQAKALTHLTRAVKAGGPIRLNWLKRQIRLIQANQDLNFTAELEPIPYTHQVKVNFVGGEKKKNFHIVASGNNLDQPIFGRDFAGLTTVSNNLTGHGDSLMTGVVRGWHSTAAFSRYEYPLTPALRATLDTQYGWIAPHQYVYAKSHEHGYAFRVSPGLKYSFLDKPNSRVSADINFDLRQAKSYSNEGLLEREFVRTLRSGINWDQNFGKTTLSTRHELAASFPFWKGSLSQDPRLSWYKGGSQYFRYTGFSTLSRALFKGSSGLLNFQWQYTPNGVSNFDVGGLGGAFYGRGYREVYIFVDRYALLSAQYQFPAFFVPKKWKMPFSSKTIRESTQLVTFCDYGYGEIAASGKGVQSTYNILGVGGGIRSQVTDRLSGRFDVAFPTIREKPYSQMPRIHFGFDVALR